MQKTSSGQLSENWREATAGLRKQFTMQKANWDAGGNGIPIFVSRGDVRSISRSGAIRTFVCFLDSPSGQQAHSSGGNIEEAALTGSNGWTSLCHLHGGTWFVVVVVVIVVVIGRKIIAIADFVFR